MRPLLIGFIVVTAAACDSGSPAPENPRTRISASPAQTAAAKKVMKNAKGLCNIYEETLHGGAPNVVVECRSSLPEDRWLQFATAIADADAVLSGQMRNIYFYVGGTQFAQADPLHGIRLK